VGTVDYETFETSTPDGPLTVGRWGHGPSVVVAAHGVTGTHAEFHALADQLGPDFSVIAPDLRGRGGSNGIPGPFGMVNHAHDIACVLDQLSISKACVLGHSMGGFVAVLAAHEYPDLVSDLVLVDGGLPPDIKFPPDVPVEQLLQAVIGPSLERLRMTFASVDDYFDFWRPHPALKDDWNAYVERYLAYDLVGEAPNLRSGVREDAVLSDSEVNLRGDAVEVALKGLTHPVVFLRAPYGVFNEEPPLYAEAWVEGWIDAVPQLRWQSIPDVNHFTILLSERGAKAVADVVRHAAR
jgi:pimeloyl-ACP methyl ester carboxylesterase